MLQLPFFYLIQGMEEILTTSVKDEDDEEKKHVLFLIKRLNTFSKLLSQNHCKVFYGFAVICDCNWKFM